MCVCGDGEREAVRCGALERDHHAGGAAERAEQHLFSRRRGGDLDVGDEDVDVSAGQIAQGRRDPRDAVPAFARPDLLVVVRVEQPEDDREAAAGGTKETRQLDGERRLGLEGRERARDVGAAEQLLRRLAERDGDARQGIAVESHRAVDDGERLPGGGSQGQSERKNLAPAAKKRDAPRRPCERPADGFPACGIVNVLHDQRFRMMDGEREYGSPV